MHDTTCLKHVNLSCQPPKWWIYFHGAGNIHFPLTYSSRQCLKKLFGIAKIFSPVLHMSSGFFYNTYIFLKISSQPSEFLKIHHWLSLKWQHHTASYNIIQHHNKVDLVYSTLWRKGNKNIINIINRNDSFLSVHSNSKLSAPCPTIVLSLHVLQFPWVLPLLSQGL